LAISGSHGSKSSRKLLIHNYRGWSWH
jgi:hypothetical protein